MSTSTAAVSPSPSVTATPRFWELLWRTAEVQSAILFIVAYFLYGDQPHVGASADTLVAFYHGGRLRVLIAAVLGGFAVLNLTGLPQPSGQPWRRPDRTAGARQRPPRAQRWARCSCSS